MFSRNKELHHHHSPTTMFKQVTLTAPWRNTEVRLIPVICHFCMPAQFALIGILGVFLAYFFLLGWWRCTLYLWKFGMVEIEDLLFGNLGYCTLHFQHKDFCSFTPKYMLFRVVPLRSLWKKYASWRKKYTSVADDKYQLWSNTYPQIGEIFRLCNSTPQGY